MITWNAALILVHLRKRELERLNAVQAISGKSSLFEGQKVFFLCIIRNGSSYVCLYKGTPRAEISHG